MRLIILFLASILLASCTKSEPLYSTRSYVFGTLVDVTTYGETESESQAIAAKIMQEFQSLHNRLHAWRPSEISKINNKFTQNAAPQKIAPDIASMIREMTNYSVQSNGLFNPAIGGLINTWGFHQDEFKAIKIDAPKLASLVAANPQMTDIVIENDTISSKNPAVQLDLGGYAKGYALDRAVQILQNNGVKNAIVNIGGNVIVLGQHGNKPWRVGIQHPRKPSAIATLNLASGWAIGTSGDYQRYFINNGKRYCHIINPQTGYPADGPQSVTVLIPPQKNAGVLSDVASKPIYLSLFEGQKAMAKQMGIEYYLIIEKNGAIAGSPKMLEQLKWLDASDQQKIQSIQ